MNTIQVGRWYIPTKLFEQYVRMVGATERSSEGYTYEFDQQRKVHDEIVEHVGLMPHTREYREFQQALQELCEEMLPGRFVPSIPTKLKSPSRGSQ
ncbi:MAG: hypothetical protein GWP10_12630 [Nitrospiraceae bacterium]|nr:hypothetical protein [Nitrospiraceae bacterium]